MISIIICSKEPSLLQRISANIAKTIGVEHEIIPVLNPHGEYGICKAYNSGASQSRYPFLCFVHEDVSFRTEHWGEIVIKILADHSIGLIGVAGNIHKMPTISGWWGVTQDRSTYRRQIIQTSPLNGQTRHEYENPLQETLADVVVLDGVWLCCRTEIWQEIPFDEDTFPGFHFYDIDFSLHVQQQYRVCVTFEMILEHYSDGNFTAAWYRDGIRFLNKWENHLPVSVSDESQETMQQIVLQEYQAGYHLLLQVAAKKLQKLEEKSQKLKGLKASKEYRLGRALLFPLKWLFAVASTVFRRTIN